MLICDTRGVSKSMELSPSWEVTGVSAGQEIILVLWKTKVHYRTHNIPPLIITQLNPIHALPTYTWNFSFNIALPSMLRSSTWAVSFMHFSTLWHRPHVPHIVAHSLHEHAVEEPHIGFFTEPFHFTVHSSLLHQLCKLQRFY